MSVFAVSASGFGFLAYYDGVQDALGNFIIEGPEFFSIAFLMVGSAIYAGLTLAFGGLVAWMRRRYSANGAGNSEQY